MGSEAIDSEPMRAREIIVFSSKFQLAGQKNIETKHLSLVKGERKSRSRILYGSLKLLK